MPRRRRHRPRSLTAASHGPFSGAVVTLRPRDPDALALPGFEPPESLHVTLAWLGDTNDDPPPREPFDVVTERLVDALDAGPGLPVVADAFAVATFNPPGFDDTRDPATVLLLQSGDLAEVRGLVQETVVDLSDFPVWFPHLTLAYDLGRELDDEEVAQRVGSIEFDRLVVAYGSDQQREIALEDSLMAGSKLARRKHRISVPQELRTTRRRATLASEDDACPEGMVQDDEGNCVELPADETGEETPNEQSMQSTQQPHRQGWEGVLVVESVPTGDGRLMERGSMRWDTPMPLRWAREDEGEHRGAVTVGRILEVWRDGDMIRGRGDLDLRIAEAAELAELMRDDGDGPTVSGVSVDLDDVDVEVRVAQEVLDRDEAMFAEMVEGEEQPEREVDEDGRVVVWEFGSDDELMVTTDGRIRAATVVDVPAFVEARLGLTELDDEPDEDEEPVEELVAGAAPDAPPREWFSPPTMGGPTPLTVTDDGRVYGHLAPWDACHTAFANECVQPPRSQTDYRYFHVGAVRTADGSEVATGRITLDTMHAGRRLSAVDTLAHYEHTGRAVADVRAGEDEFGIWVAGALRPGTDAEQARTLRASPLSGDWRRIGGSLELVAALAVNSPGFPVPRAMVASGNVVTLQSAGAIPPAEQPGPDGLSIDERAVLRRIARREAQAEAQRTEAAAAARRTVLAASAASRVLRD